MAASSSASRTVVTSAAYAGSAVLRVWTVRQCGGVHPDLAFALELADAADAVTLPRFRAADLRVDTKPDTSVVSDADHAAEQRIRDLVRERRPGEGVLGEEGGNDGGDVLWVVDPIDGTQNFVRGVPVWGTLIALAREG